MTQQSPLGAILDVATESGYGLATASTDLLDSLGERGTVSFMVVCGEDGRPLMYDKATARKL